MSLIRKLFSPKPKSNSSSSRSDAKQLDQSMIYAADSTHKLFFALNPNFVHSPYTDINTDSRVVITSEPKGGPLPHLIYPAKHLESNKWGIGQADYHRIILEGIHEGLWNQQRYFLLLLVVAHNKEELEHYLFSPMEIPALIAQEESTGNEAKSLKKLTKNRIIVIVPPDMAHSDIPQIGIPIVSLEIPSSPMEDKDRQILSNALFQMVTEASKVEQNPSLTFSTNIDRSKYRSKCRLEKLNGFFAIKPYIPAALTSIINEYSYDFDNNLDGPPLVALENSATSVHNRKA